MLADAQQLHQALLLHSDSLRSISLVPRRDPVEILLSRLARAEHLQSLVLHRVHLEEEEGGGGGGVLMLKRLELVQCKTISDHTLASLCSMLDTNTLEHVRLTDLYKVSPSTISSCISSSTRLTHLDLSGCSKTDLSLIRSLPSSLSHLNVSGCVLVDDACMLALSERCCGLSELLLEDCYRVSDAGMRGLLGLRVHVLDVSGCSLLTDRSVLEVWSRLLAVGATLVLDRCSLLSETALIQTLGSAAIKVQSNACARLTLRKVPTRLDDGTSAASPQTTTRPHLTITNGC
jgi:hypothetical protein